MFEHASELFAASDGDTAKLRKEFRKLQLRAGSLNKPVELRHDASEQDSGSHWVRSFGALRQTLRKLLGKMPIDTGTLLGHRSDLAVGCSAPLQPGHLLESPWLVEHLSRFLC